MGHTGLVAHDRGQVDGLLGIILCAESLSATCPPRGVCVSYLRESLNLSTMTSRTPAGQESKVAVAGSFVLWSSENHRIRSFQFSFVRHDLGINTDLTVTEIVRSALQHKFPAMRVYSPHLEGS